jgi:RNA polymerase sigma factor (TIGR02999 family)
VGNDFSRVNQVTRALEVTRQGASNAAEELLPLVYENLRRLAASRLAREPPGQTLQPTALVHEAWLRLVQADHQTWENKSHFFAAAAEAMRRILVERARSRRRLRHGGGQWRVPLDGVDLSAEADPDDRVLLVHEALERLASEDPREAAIVKLRFFAGLKHDEIARLLQVSEKTVRRYWTHAKAWLYTNLHQSPP